MLERDVGATMYPANRIHLDGKPRIPCHRDREYRAARLPPHPSLHEVVRLLDAAPFHLRATRRALPPRQEALRELEFEHLVALLKNR
jgi:hypothetical protein